MRDFLSADISRPFLGITSAYFKLSGKKVGKGIPLSPAKVRLFRKVLGASFSVTQTRTRVMPL